MTRCRDSTGPGMEAMGNPMATMVLWWWFRMGDDYQLSGSHHDVAVKSDDHPGCFERRPYCVSLRG